jgi:hypothetical protein
MLHTIHTDGGPSSVDVVLHTDGRSHSSFLISMDMVTCVQGGDEQAVATSQYLSRIRRSMDMVAGMVIMSL